MVRNPFKRDEEPPIDNSANLKAIKERINAPDPQDAGEYSVREVAINNELLNSKLNFVISEQESIKEIVNKIFDIAQGK